MRFHNRGPYRNRSLLETPRRYSTGYGRSSAAVLTPSVKVAMNGTSASSRAFKSLQPYFPVQAIQVASFADEGFAPATLQEMNDAARYGWCSLTGPRGKTWQPNSRILTECC